MKEESAFKTVCEGDIRSLLALFQRKGETGNLSLFLYHLNHLLRMHISRSNYHNTFALPSAVPLVEIRRPNRGERERERQRALSA